MPTFEDPAADATEAQQALRGLAHATRTIEDPRQIYEILGSLSAATASLAQSLNQIASFHDTPARETAWISGASRAGRAAAYHVSWELHRAGEVLRHVTEAIGQAHDAEATICYDHHDFPGLVDAPQVQGHNRDKGLGL